MSPASMTAPPCGAIASPQTVMMSDGVRGGAAQLARGSSGGRADRAEAAGEGSGGEGGACCWGGNVIQNLPKLCK